MPNRPPQTPASLDAVKKKENDPAHPELDEAQGRESCLHNGLRLPDGHVAEAAGVEMILVGDSVANTTLGYRHTTSVDMEDMIRHNAVTWAVEYAFVVGDMPYMSYQPSDEAAIRNAGRFIAEAGCDAVKCEGGVRVAPRIKAMVDAGLVVMGHIGLTPQSLAQLGGCRV